MVAAAARDLLVETKTPMAESAFRTYLRSRNESPVYHFSNRTPLIDHNGYNSNYTINPITVLLRSNATMNKMDATNANYPQQRTASNPSTEYADRFRSRATGRPHVVGLDGRVVTSRSGRMDNRGGFNGFFPSMKLRAATPTNGSGSSSSVTKGLDRSKTMAVHTKTRDVVRSVKPPPFILELAPERETKTSACQRNPSGTSTCQTSVRIGGAARVHSGRSTRAVNTQPHNALTSHRTARSAPDAHQLVYPYVIENPDLDDLTSLPRPTMVISRDTPWVYRYKVKRSMNELSKILASKPSPVISATAPAPSAVMQG